ncbi:hypothetical protein K491DRAFT_587112 [Lophiostoma macrostomum CBS 122681]|uniref:Clavaminate synthase-like protein n=1 Tax=Lophiostoma macrostomum CBS 122681 TaxID=1314788 RepID=A0A6A6TRS3_9PLEO|nr:hypothetical protein K491DRAFT_587112 [Lophiostoma macrostomum CBS 122681]
MAEEEYQLSDAQIEHFLEHGWIKLSGCFSREKAAELQDTLWVRLGMDPHDMSTWHTERTNMPFHNTFPISSLAPKAWGGICSLLGGSARINPSASTWKDSFIVNLGSPATHNQPVAPQHLTNWHCDGDFFVHYLDSPEQALLVIPLWTDVVPGGGGTMICPAGMGGIARHLYEHPEGVSPWMTPRGENPDFAADPRGLRFFTDIAEAMPDEAFVEVTGEVGDVYLLHPLMLHSASRNALRRIRVITNPPVGIREPFCFDREDGAYSVVERKTLKVLGRERLEGWRAQGERQGIVSAGMKMKIELKRREEERLARLREKQGSVEVKEVQPVA